MQFVHDKHPNDQWEHTKMSLYSSYYIQQASYTARNNMTEHQPAVLMWELKNWCWQVLYWQVNQLINFNDFVYICHVMLYCILILKNDIIFMILISTISPSPGVQYTLYYSNQWQETKLNHGNNICKKIFHDFSKTFRDFTCFLNFSSHSL